MLVFKFTPSAAPVVKGERLYDMQVSVDRHNYQMIGLKVRAKTALQAEQKVLFCLRRELDGKTLDFDLNKFLEAETV